MTATDEAASTQSSANGTDSEVGACQLEPDASDQSGPVGSQSAVAETQALAALNAFKDWSNYLLVTTVAAAGWISTRKGQLEIAVMQPVSLFLLSMSIVLGILTLALVPLVAEQRGGESIYRTAVKVGIQGRRKQTVYLAQLCRPQHVTFILGIISYAVGAAAVNWDWAAVTALVGAVVAVALYGFLSAPRD